MYLSDQLEKIANTIRKESSLKIFNKQFSKELKIIKNQLNENIYKQFMEGLIKLEKVLLDLYVPLKKYMDFDKFLMVVDRDTSDPFLIKLFDKYENDTTFQKAIDNFDDKLEKFEKQDGAAYRRLINNILHTKYLDKDILINQIGKFLDILKIKPKFMF